MNDVAALEAEKQEYKLQLDTIEEGLQADPDNEALKSLKEEIDTFISLLDSQIAELNPVAASASKSTSKPTSAAPAVDDAENVDPEKWSKETHPAFETGSKPPTEDSTYAPSINDTVLAKWKAGDRGFYPARVTSITGSKANPVYRVTFKSDNSSETVYSHEIRPIPSEVKKRKFASIATGVPHASSPINSPAPTYSGVISAAPTIDANLASQARGETQTAPKQSKTSKKVKATKELEGAKSKWQDFAAKGKGAKHGKKESMFRTPDGFNARVGFVGSGQEMRKDPTRSRHIYQKGADDE